MTENCVFITFVYKQNKIKEQKSKQNVKSSSVVYKEILNIRKSLRRAFAIFIIFDIEVVQQLEEFNENYYKYDTANRLYQSNKKKSFYSSNWFFLWIQFVSCNLWCEDLF